jgi:hypothetical protein
MFSGKGRPEKERGGGVREYATFLIRGSFQQQQYRHHYRRYEEEHSNTFKLNFGR